MSTDLTQQELEEKAKEMLLKIRKKYDDSFAGKLGYGLTSRKMKRRIIKKLEERKNGKRRH